MRKAKIMVVDDEAIITTRLEERLTSMGYEVIGKASSGEEALETARRLRPDLILMDIVMPGALDGIDASEKIKAEMDIPVIFLTAYTDDKFIKRAKNAEPFGYIVKPFRETEIKAAIEIALYKKDMERQLCESEKKYRSVVDNANDAIISADSHGNIISWNKAAETTFGYLADEILGKPVTSIMPKRFHKAHRNRLKRVASIEKSKIIRKTTEVVGLGKDGSEFPIEISPTTWKTKEGIFFTCIIRDITKRKQTQEQIKASLREKEVLLEEIHHRVKNNLEIISSLLDISSMRARNQEAIDLFTDARNKIQTMALIHSQLYRSDRFDQIHMGSHIQELVGFLSQVYAEKKMWITPIIEHSDVYLSVTQAIPCALVLNELISNAFKHAFKEGQKGTIEISMQSLADNTILTTVKDDGIGMPEEIDIYKAQSLGLKLVRNLVQEQLKGKIQVERNKGTEFIIKFKMDIKHA